MRSHFKFHSTAAVACAVAGAATMLNNHCAAQPYLAADYSTNSLYAGGWVQGQNGGHGFGAWSFNGTDNTPDGLYHGMSSSSSLGPAWTLLVQSSGSGLSNSGRSIPGGLQPGQTFETIIQNPVNNAGIGTYRGFDILFTSASDNNVGGNNAAALRLTVFDYFNPAMNWTLTDSDGTYRPGVSAMTTGTSGVIIDLTLLSTNTYAFSMAPVSDPNSPYFTYSGTLVGTSLPINFVNYRLWNTASSGITDTADNFEISSMTIAGTFLNAQASGTNMVLSWSTNVPGFVLSASPNLNPGAWTTNLPAPVVVGNQNFVTNPISGPQQFFRLQLVQ
jgi:hypothetical protein